MSSASLLWSVLDLSGAGAWTAYDVLRGLLIEGYPACCVAWWVLCWAPRQKDSEPGLGRAGEGWRAAYAIGIPKHRTGIESRVPCPRCRDRAGT